MTSPATKRPMKPEMNARLEWRGLELMCNDVTIASIIQTDDNGWIGCAYSFDTFSPTRKRHYKHASSARHALNRRFRVIIKEHDNG